MFDEGSPKESHRILVALGVIAALVMCFAASQATIVYRSGGREITLTEGATGAQLMGLLIPVLLIAWHRGYLGGIWPLVASLVASVFALLFLGGDWLTATSGAERDLAVSTTFYITMASAAVASAASAIACRRPIVERSESTGAWRSRHDER